MPKDPKSRWGAARIAVISLRGEISRDLAAGIPVSQIYRQHQDRLSGLTVGAFQRQVRQIVKAAVQGEAVAPEQSIRPAQPPSTVTGPNDAGHKSATGTFIHNPQVRQDDREQLLGSGGKPRDK